MLLPPEDSWQREEDEMPPLRINWTLLAILLATAAFWIGLIVILAGVAHAEVYRRVCHYSSDPRILYEVTLDDGNLSRPAYGTLIAGYNPDAVVTPIVFDRQDIAGSQLMLFFHRADNNHSFVLAVNNKELEGNGPPRKEELMTKRDGEFVIDGCEVKKR